LLSRLNRFGVDNGGATAVVAAILFPIVVGGLGLGAETGYWYLTQRKLQHIADVSAHAAGARLRADDGVDKIVAAARHMARESGYKGTPELIVNTAYTHELFPGEKLVEVVASETQPRLFSAVVARFFSSAPDMTVTMSARAVGMVAAGAGTVACVLALSPNKSGAVTVSGSTTIGLDGCDVASNSNANNSFQMDGSNAVLSTGCVYTVGTAVTSAGLTLTQCEKVKEYAPIVRDPYASVAPPPSTWGTCDAKKQGSPSGTLVTVTPQCFSGLTVMGPVHFAPGVYIINGGEFKAITGDNATVTGEGVTFYLVNGAKLNIASNVTVNFSAPTSGQYSGILFFGARDATSVIHSLAGNSSSAYTGAIYAPASAISFAGNSKTGGGGCTQIIGATVVLAGASTLKSTCQYAGTTGIATAEIVKIIE
jgi:hypothetical protein